MDEQDDQSWLINDWSSKVTTWHQLIPENSISVNQKFVENFPDENKNKSA